MLSSNAQDSPRDPRASHEQAILRICGYLKGAQDKGLVFKPAAELALDSYVDADFYWTFESQNEDDPAPVENWWMMLFSHILGKQLFFLFAIHQTMFFCTHRN